MNSIESFRRLFRYDDWANREVVARLAESDEPPSRAVRLLAHILAAEHLWLARLEQQTQQLPVWPDFTLSQCERHARRLAGLWTNYCEPQTDESIASKVDYTNTRGEPWSNSVAEILTHVVMHSSYHRGQIATLIRSAHLEPPYTDFIHATRQGLVE